jgi:hypothetical protein
MSMDFLKFNDMFFFQIYFFNYMIKKIDDHIIEFNYKKRHSIKPVNWGNHGYLIKLANRVIDCIKFNNLIFFQNHYLIRTFFKKNRSYRNVIIFF